MPLLHITTADAWDAAGELYEAPSLAADGFLHCCTPEQLPGVLARFFFGHTDLLVLEIDEAQLTSELRWEDSYGHGAFPHLYGPLPKSAVIQCRRG